MGLFVLWAYAAVLSLNLTSALFKVLTLAELVKTRSSVLLWLTHCFRPVYSRDRAAPGCFGSLVSWLRGKVLKCGVVCEAAKLRGGPLPTGPV